MNKMQEDLHMEKPPRQTINIDDGGRIILVTEMALDMSRVSSLKKYFAYHEFFYLFQKSLSKDK